jgi:hypothetical protein
MVSVGQSIKKTGVFMAAGKLLICGLLLTGVLLANLPAYADDLSDAVSAVTSIYTQYSSVFGTPSGTLQAGFDQSGNDFFAQWYVNGRGIILWSDGYSYFYNGSGSGMPISFGTIWKTSLTTAMAMINWEYNQNLSFYGTPSGGIHMGTDSLGTYYYQWFVNGTGIYCASNRYMYYFNGMWYPLGIVW